MPNPHSFPLEPTPIRVSDEALDDLRARLALTRAPLDEGNEDWSYGVPDSYLRELVGYWQYAYDWREAEAAINAYEHYQVGVTGVPVHFMRRPGRGRRPIPLILTHGWPWTFWHWSKVIDPLADPAAFGGDSADAGDALLQLITAGTILPVIIYGATVVLYLAVRKRFAAQEGAFSLGRWELPVAIGALVWLIVALLVLVLPHESRVPVLIVVGLVLAGGMFLLLMLTFDRTSLDAEAGDVGVLEA